MTEPTIVFYALFEFCDNGKKTPKYVMTRAAGDYPPMEKLKGKDGLVSFYLKENESEKPDAPSMKLQGKNSFNFTGLKDYFIDGKMSGFAFGNPEDKKTYGRKKVRENPFYEYRTDGYLFVMDVKRTKTARYGDKEITIPVSFELLVLDGGIQFIPSYCKELVIGGFAKDLEVLRKLAVSL